MFTWTNQPYESMWNHLRMLQVPKNVEALLTGRMKSHRPEIFEENESIERKSRQIAYAIQQADEYFSAGDNSSISTSPLMYFYGMLSLAKAMIVANDKSLYLEDIKYHGLYTRPITEDLSTYTQNQEDWCLDDEYAVTNEGVLSRFINLVHDFKIPAKSVIKFKNILKINPEIGDIFNRYYNEPPHFFPLYTHKLRSEPFSLEINPLTVDKELFSRSFGYILIDFELSDEILHSQALIIKNKPSLEQIPDYMGIYNPIPGGSFLVSGMEYTHDGNLCRKYLCPEICDYIGMFILGDIVRYKQEFWGQTINGEKEGAIALVNLFVAIARNRFPNFILNKIFYESFSYGSVGRLM